MAKKISVVKSFGIRLHGIEFISMLLSPRPINGFKGTEFNFNIKVEMKVNDIDELIASIVSVEVSEVNTELILANLVIGVGVLISEFKDIVKIGSKNRYDIPKDLENLVRTISISTVRGILYSELRGTYLHNAILPIVINTLSNNDTP